MIVRFRCIFAEGPRQLRLQDLWGAAPSVATPNKASFIEKGGVPYVPVSSTLDKPLVTNHFSLSYMITRP